MATSPSSPRTEIAAGGLARLRILDELQILTPYQKKEETEESHLLNWIPLPSEVPSTPHEATTNPLPSSSTTSDLENFVKRIQDQHQKRVKHQHQATSSSFSSSSATSSKKISSISVEKSSSFTGSISDEKLGNLNNSNNITSDDLHRGSQLRPSASTSSVHRNLHLELSPKSTTYKPEDELLLTPSPIVKGSVMSPRIVIDSKESEECLARGIKLFNEKPKKGLELLWTGGIIGRTPESVATFFHDCSQLNKVQLGDYLSEDDELASAVLYRFVDQINFEYLDFDIALRRYLYTFRLPGEAQKIDRVLQAFSEHYYKSSGNDVFKSPMIMLNTDMYNPHVKTKMTLAEFIRNNRGINEESDLPLEYLEDIYQRIRQEEIKLVRDELKLPNAVKKGWIQMLTKGAMGTSWKRRWCVLADDTIHIFKKLEDTNAAVTISLSHYTLTTHLGPSDLKAAQRRKNCLKLLNNMAESMSGSGSKALRDKEPSSYLFSFTSEKEVTSWISTVNAHVHYPQKLKPTASSDHNEIQHSPKNSTSDPPKTKRKEEDGLHVQINNSKPESSSGEKKGSRISFQKKETQEKKGGSATSEGGDKSLRRCSSASATLGQTLT